MEYLVEASAAEAEAISATLAAAKARQVNGEVELPDRDCGGEASPSGTPTFSLMKPDSMGSAGIRLHHRAVSATLVILNNNIFLTPCSSFINISYPRVTSNTFLVYNGSGTCY